MHPRIRKWGLGLALAAAFYMAGGHWATLQAVAWGGMLVKYSAASGLREGLKQTFDGMHPCPLCLAIQRAQQADHPTDQLASNTPESRLLAASPPAQDLVSGADLLVGFFSVRFVSLGTHRNRPPVPPPRSINSCIS